MPGPERRDRLQKAVLWARSGTDAYGQPKVSAAVEVMVRWNDKQRLVLDAQGNTVAMDATALILQDIDIGSILRLGALADLPASPDNLMEVKVFNSTPDLKARNYQKEVGLVRWSNTLPVVG